MATVYAKKAVGIRHGKGMVNLARGQAVDADHELVARYPDLFEAEPSKALGRRPGQVERATRAPGEKRTTPRKRAPAE